VAKTRIPKKSEIIIDYALVRVNIAFSSVTLREKEMQRLVKIIGDEYGVSWTFASTAAIEWAAELLAQEVGYAAAAAEMKILNLRREKLQLRVDCPSYGTPLWNSYCQVS
jgi:hypothetical protein